MIVFLIMNKKLNAHRAGYMCIECIIKQFYPSQIQINNAFYADTQKIMVTMQSELLTHFQPCEILIMNFT